MEAVIFLQCVFIHAKFNVFVLKVPAGDECAWWTVIQIVGIHVECIIFQKLPMQVNSSYSFSSGPKKPRCSVLLLPPKEWTNTLPSVIAIYVQI